MRLRGTRHVNGRYRLMGRAPRRPSRVLSATIRAGRGRVALAICALVLAATISACGSSSTKSNANVSVHIVPAPLDHPTQATLILDFTPNAVHTGIYRAL